jgi:hypothetical protein
MDDGPRAIGDRHALTQVRRQAGRVWVKTTLAATVFAIMVYVL